MHVVIYVSNPCLSFFESCCPMMREFLFKFWGRDCAVWNAVRNRRLTVVLSRLGLIRQSFCECVINLCKPAKRMVPVKKTARAWKTCSNESEM